MSTVYVQQPSGLATVAHELRGPLTALHTATELLDRDFDRLDLAQIRLMVASMHRRALSLRGLMENLLTAAVLNDGQLRVSPRPVDMHELFEEVGYLVQPILTRKQQSLRVHANAALPIVAADPSRIGQVLLNLVTNASKYSGPETLIEIRTTTPLQHVRVTVADRGPGISRKVGRRLFEPYYRAERTDSDGLGIGLSVVRSIIEAHGGRVGVKNRRSGGAAFWFEVPAAFQQ
jgi:two-component system sensor histidine kinase KdpD